MTQNQTHSNLTVLTASNISDRIINNDCLCAAYHPNATIKVGLNDDQRKKCRFGFLQILEAYDIYQNSTTRNNEDASEPNCTASLDLLPIDFCGYPWDLNPLTSTRPSYFCALKDDQESCEKERFHLHVKCKWFDRYCAAHPVLEIDSNGYCTAFKTEEECNNQSLNATGKCTWYEKKIGRDTTIPTCCDYTSTSIVTSPWCQSIGLKYDKSLNEKNSGFQGLSCSEVVGKDSIYQRKDFLKLGGKVVLIDGHCCFNEEEEVESQSNHPTLIPSRAKGPFFIQNPIPSFTTYPAASIDSSMPSSPLSNDRYPTFAPVPVDSPSTVSIQEESSSPQSSSYMTALPTVSLDTNPSNLRSPSTFAPHVVNSPISIPAPEELAPSQSSPSSSLSTLSPTSSMNVPPRPDWTVTDVGNDDKFNNGDENNRESTSSTVVLVASAPLIFIFLSFVWKSRNKILRRNHAMKDETDSSIEDPTMFQHIEPNSGG